MRVLLFILCLVLGQGAAFAQRTSDFVLSKTIGGDIADFTVDNLGNIYVLTGENQLKKLSPAGDSLAAAGVRNYRMVLVGEGSEREWLRKHLHSAEMPGLLRGEALAAAFAGMDAFVFPSRTDTFGLVLLEAMASGVPVIVSPDTAARVGIEDGVQGFHAADLPAFTRSILELLGDPSRRHDMGLAARRFACSRAWDGVFDQLYRTYEIGLEEIGRGANRSTEVPVTL